MTTILPLPGKSSLAAVATSTTVTDAPQPPSIATRREGAWKKVAFVASSAALAVTAAVALYAFHRVSTFEARMERMGVELNARFQRLDANLNEEGRRRRLLLGIRDEILKTNPKAGLNGAYRYSEWLVAACEKYPSVDPLLLLSIGIVESGYNPAALSQANARGLYQISPTTGRLLARALDWEYSDAMLFDPQKNTEMAAFYLDVLFSAYRDARMVLAEYNGGPVNAGYWRAGSRNTAAETRDYVLMVSDLYERFQAQFEGVPVARLGLEALERGRDATVLGGAPPAGPPDAETRREAAGVGPVLP